MTALIRFEDLEIPALTVIAQEQYEECLWAIQKALDKQLAFGRLLLIVKSKLPHGEWGNWVRETFADLKSLRTIQRYMRGADSIATDPSLLECADSLDGILKIVEERKPSVEVIEGAASVPQVVVPNEQQPALRLGDNQHGKEGAVITSPSQDDAAKALGVSRDSVRKARKVRAKATKKVIAAVESGTMSLNAAVKTTKPDKPKKKNGAEKVSATKLVDALTKQHIGHIARGLTTIAKANGGEGVQFKAADAGLNQMIFALKKMREGET